MLSWASMRDNNISDKDLGFDLHIPGKLTSGSVAPLSVNTTEEALWIKEKNDFNSVQGSLNHNKDHVNLTSAAIMNLGLVCSHPLVKCKDELNCVEESQLCDGIEQCQDGSDESDFSGCGTDETGPVVLPPGVVAGIVVCCLLAVVAIVLGVIAAYITKKRRQRGGGQTLKEEIDKNRRNSERRVQEKNLESMQNGTNSTLQLQPGTSDDNIHRAYRAQNGLENRGFTDGTYVRPRADPPKLEVIHRRSYAKSGRPVKADEQNEYAVPFQDHRGLHMAPLAKDESPNDTRDKKRPYVGSQLYENAMYEREVDQDKPEQERPRSSAKLPYFHRSYDDLKSFSLHGKNTNVLRPTPSTPSINDIGISPWAVTNPVSLDHHSISLTGIGIEPLPTIGIPGEKSAFRRVNSAPLNLADSSGYHLYDNNVLGGANLGFPNTRTPVYDPSFGIMNYGELTV